MNTQAIAFLPKARSEGLITKEVEGEVLVYDRERDQAHCLNETAAAIWKLCDGCTGVPELTGSVSKSLGIPVGEIVIQLGLKQLSANHLLVEGYEVASLPVNSSRRNLVRRLGVGVALLPLITSLSAPTALAAVSCGGPCTGGPGRGSCPAGCVCSPITSLCEN
jgi:coenzyme PQQ synthesis protein D (PqqD)